MKRKFYFLFMCLMAVQYSMAQSEPGSLLSAGKAWIMCYTPDEPMSQGPNGYVEQMLGDEIVKDNISFREILKRGCQIVGKQCPPPDYRETGHALIGLDVTDKITQGPVVINSGNTKINASQGATITKDFEVKLGAEFMIFNE